MSSTKSILALMLIGMGMLIRAEPQLSNTYLPPDQGYNYERPSVTFPTPTRPTRPSRPTGPPTDGHTNLGEGDHHHGDGHVHMPGMPYDFAYAVKDDYYGTDYAHNAVSDGDVVKGEYRVQLPDGRLQIVRYTADWKTGFHADVQYEGEPQYPQTQPGNQGYNYPSPSAPSGGGGGGLYGPPKTGY